MNKFEKDFENLSAYIDGELSETEKDFLEEKLKSSSLLRETLHEYENIHKSISSIKPLKEDSYFETRLFEEIKNENRKSTFTLHFRKPVAVFALITIAAMVFFKFNPDFFETFYSNQKKNLNELYLSNLRPLIYSSNLTSEDIFNFAFNKTLPLDNEKQQVLSLDVDKTGRGFLEVKYAADVGSAINMQAFINALKLNDIQKKEVDSILQSYSNDLNSQVLVNDKNTLAVNPNIWNYQNAIRTDLIKYAANTNSEVVKKILPENFIIPPVNEIKTVIKTINENPDNLYFIITPDSIFSSRIEIDHKLLQKEIAKIQEEMKFNEKEVKKSLNKIKFDLKMFKPDSSVLKDFEIYVNDNVFKVQIPKYCNPDQLFPNFDSINKELEKAVSKFKDYSYGFKFDIEPGDKTSKYYFKGKSGGPDSLGSFNYEFRIPDFPKNEMGGQKIDSLFKKFNFFMNGDSIHFNFPKGFGTEMEQLRKEMESFRQEMEKWREENKKNQQEKIKKKKVIEV